MHLPLPRWLKGSTALAMLLATPWLAPAVASELAEEPQRPVRLKQVRVLVYGYTQELRVPDGPFGAYREPGGKGPSLYASCDVAIMRTIMGEDLKESLTEAERRAWIDHINSFAREDGTYARYRGHSHEHANGMVIGALGVLGGRQRHPVRLYDAFDTPEEVGPWLERIDWRKQWSGSHLFWGGMHCYSTSRRASPAWRDAVFTWLDANLDPRTGWWRKGVAHASPLEPLGGAAHIWPMYQHHDRRFPYPERVIDSILALQKPDGSWLSYGNYMELDALYGLCMMRALAPEHRREEVLGAARRHGRGLAARWPQILRRKPTLHALLGTVGAFGLLNQMLPETYRDNVRWTDIFSDRRLYQTSAVAVGGKGVGTVLPARPEGCFAQKGPDPRTFFRTGCD